MPQGRRRKKPQKFPIDLDRERRIVEAEMRRLGATKEEIEAVRNEPSPSLEEMPTAAEAEENWRRIEERMAELERGVA